MFRNVKTIRLDDFGREIEEWHHAETTSLAEIVAKIESRYPNSILEARYVR